LTYNVEYRALANRDIDNIGSWLKQFYPSTPVKFQNALQQFERNVAETPRMYAPWSANPKFHEAVVDKYLVFYTVHDKLQTVRVHRVLRGSWDIPRHMR
jgi:plasmid stabilization system protein ParE